MRPPRRAARRSSLVAAIIHTSIGSLRVPPSRRTVRSSTAFSSLPCRATGRSPTSSRNSVPPCAAWKRPALACRASVNAPFSWPNSSDSRRDSGMAAQLTSTKGRPARGPPRCSIRARRPLPVPVSPSMRIAGRRPEATRWSRPFTCSRTAASAGLCPSSSTSISLALGTLLLGLSSVQFSSLRRRSALSASLKWLASKALILVVPLQYVRRKETSS